MANNNNVGVITEQGYVAGEGLGFNPIKESELHPNKKNDKDSKDKDNK